MLYIYCGQYEWVSTRGEENYTEIMESYLSDNVQSVQKIHAAFRTNLRGDNMALAVC